VRRKSKVISKQEQDRRDKQCLVAVVASEPPQQQLLPRTLLSDGERLIFKAELLAITALSFPTIWLLMRAGRFPRARNVGARPAWLSSEISAWIADLPVRRYKGDGETTDSTSTVKRAQRRGV
jgi:predicted DNA-binding transcriptional regulator AlpA